MTSLLDLRVLYASAISLVLRFYWSPPIRILHVIASIAQRTGGPAKAALDMARAVARLGHEVSVYTTDREMEVRERPSTLR